jgi:hypothetical protein
MSFGSRLQAAGGGITILVSVISAHQGRMTPPYLLATLVL